MGKLDTWAWVIFQQVTQLFSDSQDKISDFPLTDAIS